MVLARIAAAIDGVNDWFGRMVAWLTLGCVVVCFVVVFLRYVLSIGFIWLQELYVWQHAAVFMVGAGYTFLRGGQVRVDLFYSRMSERGQAIVDLIGSILFLLPWLAVLVLTSVPFVLSSWRILEWSSQAGGLPGLFLLKSIIWLFAALVGLQGVSTICKSLLVLTGHSALVPARPGTGGQG